MPLMKQRFFLTLMLLSLATGLAYLQLGRPPLGVDDAHIFFVYGRNIAQGHGIVYNPGGERVEGYSSPLWLALVTAAFALLPVPEAGLLAVSVLMAAAAVAVLWHWLDGGERLGWRGAVLLAWVFSAPSYVVWTTLTLMESALWSTLLIVTTVTLLQGNTLRRLGVCLALVALARPEALVWGPLFLGLAFWLAVLARGGKTAVRETALLLAFYGVAQGALLLLRLAYFGFPLPNTYYAKISPDIGYNLWQGLIYLLGFITINKHAIYLVIGPAIAGLLLNIPWAIKATLAQTSGQSDPVRARYVTLSVLALAGLAIPVWSGGDHFGLFRFYQPVWPLLILPLFALIDTLHEQLPFSLRQLRRPLILTAVALLFILPTMNWSNPRYRLHIEREFALAANGQRLGEALNEIFDSDLPAVGVIASGGVAVTYQGVVVDVMGLNNVQMAHAPGDRYGIKNHAAFNGDVFLRQGPELFLPELGPIEDLAATYHSLFGWHNAALAGFLDDARFAQQYRLALISKGDRHIMAYVARNHLSLMERDGYMVTAVFPGHDLSEQ
jgi:arabinofuranosyltransferase